MWEEVILAKFHMDLLVCNSNLQSPPETTQFIILSSSYSSAAEFMPPTGSHCRGLAFGWSWDVIPTIARQKSQWLFSFYCFSLLHTKDANSDTILHTGCLKSNRKILIILLSDYSLLLYINRPWGYLATPLSLRISWRQSSMQILQQGTGLIVVDEADESEFPPPRH